ncbi:hypothetical protein FQN60_002130, partial [Etheostoma spectabile]
MAHRLSGEDIPLDKLGHLEAQTAPSRNSPLNLNHYATKKSAAQSMLDVALLMANSAQLKTVLYVGPRFQFYIPLLVLLSLSIALQCDLNDESKHVKLNRMNNVATVLVFFTVLINVFITALGHEDNAG